MKTTLYFTREFTKGLLKGIRHIDSLSFVSVESAENWRKGIARNHKRGSLNYKLVDASYQSYIRN